MGAFVAARRPRDLLDVLSGGLHRLGDQGCDGSGVVLLGPDRVVRHGRGRLTHPSPGPFGIARARGTSGTGDDGVPGQDAPLPVDCTSKVAVVHEGTVENAPEISALLRARGHRLRSGDGGEVVAHLVEEELALGWDLSAAVRISTGRLRGSWALAVLAAGHDRLVLTARGCPLVVGFDAAGPVASSEFAALAGCCDAVGFLHDDDLVEFHDGHDGHDGGVRWFDHHERPVHRPRTRTARPPRPPAPGDPAEAQAGAVARQIGEWFPAVRSGTVWERLGLPVPERVRFLACGSARNAADAAARVLRRFGGIDCVVTAASEHDPESTRPGETTIACSPSGETAAVLSALDADAAHRGGRGPLLVVTDAPGSPLARRADAVLDLGGPGPTADASETFTAQVLAGVFLGLSAAVSRARWPRAVLSPLLEELLAVPEALHLAADTADVVAHDLAPRLAARLATRPGLLVVGRGAALPHAAQAALDLGELTHHWVQCHPSGELEHGLLALVGPGTPVVVVEDGAPAPDPVVHEVSARGADVLRVGRDGGCAFPVLRSGPHPWGPLESTVALRRLAHHLAAPAATPATPATPVTV
ncbi:SIS domain-containing protein [Kineococcus halophytocola]|uniref:SIS domain-containing protein n=1 Tax=Kineococcus halophytocola TaxID=3234027 RepID=UPI00351AA4B7